MCDPTPVAVLEEVVEELYEGDWSLLRADLEARLGKKPVVQKFFEKIRLDLAQIARRVPHGQED